MSNQLSDLLLALDCHLALVVSLVMALRGDALGLLLLELAVEHVQGALEVLGRAGDGEHALARLVVRVLGDADLRARGRADLVDLGAAASDDAADLESNSAERNVSKLQMRMSLSK